MNPRKKASSPLIPAAGAAPRQAVVGLEAEFTLLVDGEERRPEIVFHSPAEMLRHHGGRIIPRAGRSCHLPSGGALYFDTGVVEVATAPIELEAPGGAGCARAVRSLWEQIAFVRRQLDAWETQWGKNLRLRGFSAHYNFSVAEADGPRLNRLARALCCLLPVPVMLLAANRRSTAVGARPRPGRIEITADFTPDPALMQACVALLAGIIAETARWPEADFAPAALAARGLPLIAHFRPSKHTSRKGWRAHADDFPGRSPFVSDVNQRDWLLTDGRQVSLRQIGCEMLGVFRASIRRFAGPAAYTHLREVMSGTARSLLDFPEGPPAYADVGRVIDWGRRRARTLPRSAYEKVIQRVIAHEPLRIGRRRYLVERMPGWYEFIFRDVQSGARRVFDLDELARRISGAGGA